MKKFVMITSDFPPEPGIQSRRMGERAQYLAKKGWDVTVITPWKEKYRDLYPNSNDGDLTVKRLKPFLFKFFPSMDYWTYSIPFFLKVFAPFLGFIRWFPKAGFFLRKILDKDTILYTINNPVALHFSGFMSWKKSGKWVSEFRDPWVGYEYSRRGFLGKLLDNFLEKQLVKRSHKICFRKGIQVSLNELFERYPKQKEKFVQLPDYGVDLNDFNNLTVPDDLSSIHGVFAGDFHGTSTPENLISALSKLNESGVKGHIDFYGKVMNQFPQSPYANFKGFIQYKELIKKYAKAHFTIVYDEATDEKSQKYFFPSKLSELIALRRPILYIGNPGTITANLISENTIGITCSANVESIKKGLLNLNQMIQNQSFNHSFFDQIKDEISLENSEESFIKDVLNG